ncbi:MAG TPA: phytanoyl-CoA dioxygenase family protein [Acetobacteraceae bacterium]|nr:phytanoyl-CoA dioxygenase family protein [Acetobacteraceae bacterium]
MAASLSPTQVAQYRRDGFLFPVDCLTQDEVHHYRSRLEAFEQEQGDTLGKLPDLLRSKTHLLFSWMDALVRHPKVLDAVESIIGPDILLYHLTSWLKEPQEPSHVSWHQDGTYFGLEPYEQITAWIALTDATPEMGCIRLIPGSHVIGQRPHKDTATPGNLLSRGQTIEHKLDYANYVMMPLRAGQISLHHTHVVHSSEPNQTQQRRIGIGASYIPTHCRLVNGDARVTAMLMRGRDGYGHFDAEPRPAGDFDVASRAAHADAVARFFESNKLLAARRRSGNVGI